MKKKYRSVFYFLTIPFLFWSCSNDDFSIPELQCNLPENKPNQTVWYVLSSSNSLVSQYKFDDVIEAYVVSSDEQGNFFKTISLQTLATPNSKPIGFSIPIDASNLYIDYQLGNKVTVKLKNQYTDLYFGGLRIGGLYVNLFNEGGVGRLSQNDYKNVLNASCTILNEAQLIRKTTLAELTTESNLNTLVEVSDVQFTESGVGRKFYEEVKDVGGGTNWSLVDRKGNQVLFRTSGYADFASKLVPSGSGKVRGILTKFGTDYQLVSRFEKDIDLNEKRAVPFFSEDFDKVVDKSNLSLPGWENVVQKGTTFWKGTVYAGNGYAEFNTTGTKVVSNIAWLISPLIDMNAHTNEILTFRTAQHHLDIDSPLNALEVYVSNDFDGVDIAGATWIPLQVNLPKQATTWYQFVGSGGIDLSSFKGKINIAFKYIGSGKNLLFDGAFQLDDVQVYGNK